MLARKKNLIDWYILEVFRNKMMIEFIAAMIWFKGV